MNTFFIFLAIFLAIVFLAYLAIAVFIHTLEKRPDSEEDSLGDTVESIFREIGRLIFLLLFTFVWALVTFFSYVIIYWRWILFAGFLIGGVELIVQFHEPMLTEIDAQYTEHGADFYRDVFLEVANVLRIFFDIVICWVNLIQSFFRILFTEFVNLAADCEEME